MKAWRIILAVTLIFSAGAVTGAIVARKIAPRIVKTERVSPPPNFTQSPERRKEYLDRLESKLNLSGDQKQKIDGILRASQTRLRSLWDNWEPQAKEEFQRTRKEITEVLSEEQRELYRQMRKHRSNDKNDRRDQKPIASESK